MTRLHELDLTISERRLLRRYRWQLTIDGYEAGGRSWTNAGAVRQAHAVAKAVRFLSVIDPELAELVPA